MNVLHVINSLKKGGAENLVLDSIVGFQKYFQESRNYLFVLYGQDEIGIENYGFCEVFFGNSSLKKLPITALKWRKRINSHDFDVVHTHLFDSMVFGRLLGHKKLVHTYHSIDYRKGALHHSPWRIAIDKWTYKNTQSIPVYVSNSVREAVQSQIPAQMKKGIVLPNFCREDFTYSWQLREKKPFRIIAVGNLREAKNYPFLIEALSEFNSDQCVVDIYGEGKLKRELERLIANTGAPVNLMGAVNISSKLFSQYDLFIMTSRIEGMPVALIEAIASGMPSLLPGHLPVMKEVADQSALYFSDQKELQNMLKNIIENPSVLSGLSEKTKRQKEQYLLRNYIQTLKRVYTN